MGRMAEARKRARRGAAEPTPPAPGDAASEPESGPATASEAPAEAQAPVEAASTPDVPPEALAEESLAASRETPVEAPAGGAAVDWVASDEVVSFPAEPEGAADLAQAPLVPARVSLPSSGLAQDILRTLESPEPVLVPAVADKGPSPGARSHSLSFFGAAMREEHQAVEATEHLVTFLLATEEYGVDVRLVQEIIRVSSITPVPRAPEFIKGVINLRGRIIPVVDLKRKLELGSVDAAGKRARIVVVRLRDRLIGVLVDGASQVLKVPLSVIEAAPEEVVSIAQSFIRGVAKLEKRLIILVALQEILLPALREAEAEAEAGAEA